MIAHRCKGSYQPALIFRSDRSACTLTRGYRADLQAVFHEPASPYSGADAAFTVDIAKFY